MMPRLIKQLKQHIPSRWFIAAKNTHRPLLNNTEILDLLLRVQGKKNTRRHKHEIASKQIGDIRSLYRGYGMDYEESRRYQAGDDTRYMNWQLSARTGTLYMKVFREERQPGVFILLDRRASMRFGTQSRLKITQAARAAAIAAFSAQDNNLSLGGVILNNELGWFKETQNKQAVFDFIHQAARPAAPIFSSQKTEEPVFDNVLRMLNTILTAGTTIYLISDFHDLDTKSQAVLLQLASAHQVHAIQITDPAEVMLPRSGSLQLKSADSNKTVTINSNSRADREMYQSAAEHHFSEKKSLFENMAISYHEILTSTETIEEKIIF